MKQHVGLQADHSISAGTRGGAATGARVRESRAYAVAKRAFDIVAGTVSLVILFPLFPVVALMIRLDTPGPIFYRQTRLGKGGKPFKFLKFRSMYGDADRRLTEVAALNEQDGPVFKIKSDPRITAVGRFLRRSSFDELPQILNVIRGEMSIVGPRPPLPTEVERYRPWHRSRLDVKPGITCLWQISGRSHIGFEEWMRLDMEYLKTRSFKTDLLIFLKTIPAVITRRGAY